MQVLVVGAGVIGLAIARALARSGHEVIVAEAESAIGTGTSSRHSEVIHAGLYYPTGSLRARHCVRSRRMLYQYCAERGVPHRKAGKLVVATSDAEVNKLKEIYKQAQINECENIELIDAAAAKRMEPEVHCVAAMNSPETGIIDSHSYMLALRGEVEDHGGMVALNTRIERLVKVPAGWQVHFGADEPIVVDAVVNSAGLGAQKLACATEGYPHERVPRLVLAKGSYFSYCGRPVFKRLIYPVPIPGGLGVHVTLDLAGRMRFGPDVEWIDEENYDVDPRRGDSFYASVRRYWPRLPDNSLVPDYAGIRPKISGQGEPQMDFLIDAPKDHGVPRLVMLFGMESPGLTSSLSIGEEVAGYLSS
ncbi:MAG TPA: NAD(P)/FAD-dependent oxidoreductase [Alphaproteobacteria bacterium]|nr:NAD(P)/FAD-dependent oxidoreductase [Alphaproteobacteria bacterium]